MSTPSALRRRLRDTRRQFQRTAQVSDAPMFALLLLAVVAITLAGSIFPDYVPQVSLLLPLFVATTTLGPRSLPWFTIATLVATLVLVLSQASVVDIDRLLIIRVAITFVIGLYVLLISFRRSRLGVSGGRGESMLVDLRDRIAKQGTVPDVPQGWYAESVTRSAGGTQFAGDFLVASRSTNGRTLSLVVVDVSGKGVEAGTRALLLSGAFGGLVAALPPQEFLPAANDYLLRQEWAEGFATAIHLHLDLTTGYFEMRKAGHPPGVWMHAGSGRWTVHESDGPVLGLIPDQDFDPVCGTLQHGDALLLFTDGLVETTTRDITSGIDKLAGRAQRLFRTGFEGGARLIVDDLDRTGDDRALLLVHRR